MERMSDREALENPFWDFLSGEMVHKWSLADQVGCSLTFLIWFLRLILNSEHGLTLTHRSFLLTQAALSHNHLNTRHWQGTSAHWGPGRRAGKRNKRRCYSSGAHCPWVEKSLWPSGKWLWKRRAAEITEGGIETEESSKEKTDHEIYSRESERLADLQKKGLKCPLFGKA